MLSAAVRLAGGIGLAALAAQSSSLLPGDGGVLPRVRNGELSYWFGVADCNANFVAPSQQYFEVHRRWYTQVFASHRDSVEIAMKIENEFNDKASSAELLACHWEGNAVGPFMKNEEAERARERELEAARRNAQGKPGVAPQPATWFCRTCGADR